MEKEAMETGNSYARKENREKSHKLKVVIEQSTFVLWFVFC